MYTGGRQGRSSFVDVAGDGPEVANGLLDVDRSCRFPEDDRRSDEDTGDEDDEDAGSEEPGAAGAAAAACPERQRHVGRPGRSPDSVACGRGVGGSSVAPDCTVPTSPVRCRGRRRPAAGGSTCVRSVAAPCRARRCTAAGFATRRRRQPRRRQGGDRPAGGHAGTATASALAAAAAVAGHNWSPFLRGAGGRGVAPALGSLLAGAPAGAAYLGRARCRTAEQTDRARLLRRHLALVPVARRGTAGRGSVATAVLVPLLAKRIAGNRAPPAGWDAGTIASRLLFDDDPGAIE